MVKVAEKFYTNLCSNPNTLDRGAKREAVDMEVPSVTTDEVKFALGKMSRGKVGGEDGLNVDLFKYAGDLL